MDQEQPQRETDHACERCKALLRALAEIAQPITPLPRDVMAQLALDEYQDHEG